MEYIHRLLSFNVVLFIGVLSKVYGQSLNSTLEDNSEIIYKQNDNLSIGNTNQSEVNLMIVYAETLTSTTEIPNVFLVFAKPVEVSGIDQDKENKSNVIEYTQAKYNDPKNSSVEEVTELVLKSEPNATIILNLQKNATKNVIEKKFTFPKRKNFLTNFRSFNKKLKSNETMLSQSENVTTESYLNSVDSVSGNTTEKIEQKNLNLTDFNEILKSDQLLTMNVTNTTQHLTTDIETGNETEFDHSNEWNSSTNTGISNGNSSVVYVNEEQKMPSEIEERKDIHPEMIKFTLEDAVVPVKLTTKPVSDTTQAESQQVYWKIPFKTKNNIPVAVIPNLTRLKATEEPSNNTPVRKIYWPGNYFVNKPKILYQLPRAMVVQNQKKYLNPSAISKIYTQQYPFKVFPEKQIYLTSASTPDIVTLQDYQHQKTTDQKMEQSHHMPLSQAMVGQPQKLLIVGPLPKSLPSQYNYEQFKEQLTLPRV